MRFFTCGNPFQDQRSRAELIRKPEGAFKFGETKKCVFLLVATSVMISGAGRSVFVLSLVFLIIQID
jgi:hypothetical protein